MRFGRLVGAFGLLLSSTSDLSAQEVTAQRIFDAWRARGERVKSLEIHWTERNTYWPGALTSEKPGRSYPDAETHVENKGSFYLDGERWRIQRDGPNWSVIASEFIEMQEVQVAGDGTYTSFRATEGRTDEDHPVAHLYPLTGDRQVMPPPPLLPVGDTYRAFHPHISDLRAEEWTLQPGEHEVNGRRCVLLLNRTRPQAPAKCWVDLDDDFSIVRRTVEVRPMLVEERDAAGNPTRFSYSDVDWMVGWTADIWYQDDPAVGSVPSRWVGESAPQSVDRQVRHRQEAQVVSFRVNEPIDPAVFTVAFPPGTEVYDQRQKPEYHYVVRDDGEPRTITRAEARRDLTYHDLLDTESGQAGLPKTGRTSYAFLYVTAAVAFLIAAVVALRRRNS